MTIYKLEIFNPAAAHPVRTEIYVDYKAASKHLLELFEHNSQNCIRQTFRITPMQSNEQHQFVDDLQHVVEF